MENKELAEMRQEKFQLKEAQLASNNIIVAIAGLTDIQKVSLEGYYLGLRHKDIAKSLGVEVEEVHTAFREALEALDSRGYLDFFQILTRNYLNY